MNGEVRRAVEILRRGGLVAFPTETVYGLGADAGNDRAVERLYAVKGRPADHPVIVHLGSREQLPEWVEDVTPSAAVLTETFWPGPLTVLLRRGARASSVVTGGRATVGLRVPDHPLALELLDSFGGGIAAPSANRFGRVSPTTAAHVAADLGDDVDLILDGGPCSVGVESTIVDCTVDPPQVLRAGGVTAEMIRACLGTDPGLPAGPARAPGMLESHYAPRCAVVLAPTGAAATAEVHRLLAAGQTARALLIGDDLTRVAHTLYQEFRRADDDGIAVLVAELPGSAGLGLALRDRLQKAARAR